MNIDPGGLFDFGSGDVKRSNDIHWRPVLIISAGLSTVILVLIGMVKFPILMVFFLLLVALSLILWVVFDAIKMFYAIIDKGE